MRIWRKSRILVISVVVILLMLISWIFWPQSAVMLSGKVIKQDLIQSVSLSGVVVPFRKSIIAASYNGFIRKIFVAVGDKVKAGDPVVTVAQSLTNIEEQVFPLRAPFNGTVVQVLRSEGEYIESGGGYENRNSIVRIDDLSHMYFEGIAPEIDVPKLKVNQEVMIRAPAVFNRSYKGVIRFISLAAREQNYNGWEKTKVEFTLKGEILDPDQILKSGMSVVLEIIAFKIPQVLTLRHEFIQREKDQYYATTVKGEKKPIQIGAQNEEWVEIKSGLSEGDEVKQVDFLSLYKER